MAWTALAAPRVMLFHSAIVLLVLLGAWNTGGHLSQASSTDKVLRVTTILVEPYMMLDWPDGNATGKPHYYGYISDLLLELSKVVGFRYKLHTVPDNTYGFRRSDGTWDGMIGELRRKDADIAAGALLVTERRKEVVDFTMPFLNVQGTMLLRKPPVGATLKIKTITDLINQSEIKYGTIDKGIIPRAFKKTNDTFERILWRNMRRFEPSVFTATNEAGIERVRKEKYAFIIQDTIAEYIALQSPCDLITVDKFLLKRGYALALAKESPWIQPLNQGLRMLAQNGFLDDLYKTWWYRRSSCNGIQSSKVYSLNQAHSPLNRLPWRLLLLLCVIVYVIDL